MEEPSAAVRCSVEDLRSVSSAISKFIGTWDDLCTLLESINSSMDSLSAQLDETAGSSPQSPPVGSPKAEAVDSLKGENHDTYDNAPSDKEDDRDHESNSEDCSEHRPEGPEHKDATDIEIICNSTAVDAGKQLRRYVIHRLPSGLSQLYDEIPAALARAQDPATLVLGSVGRFFRQGKRTFVNPASVESGNRRAAVLILEFFLLSGRVVPRGQLKPTLRHLATTSAWEWKKRMLSEGGVSEAEAEDALGLLLLLASFGIPPKFGNDDVVSLIGLSSPKQKVHVLRLSPILVKKMPEIIHYMVKCGMHLAAAELVIVFKLQKKFPLLPLLSSCLDTIKRERVGEQEYEPSSLNPKKETFENLLSKLQSLADLVDDHGLYTKHDSLDLAATISKLKNDMLNFNQKLWDSNANRKAEETAPLEKADTRLKSPHDLNVKRNAEETAPLDRIGSDPTSCSLPTSRVSEYATFLNKLDTGSLGRPSSEHLSSGPCPMNTELGSGLLERIESYSSASQILNFNIKETTSTARIESLTKPLQTFNAKRKFEETSPSHRSGIRQKPLALPWIGMPSENAVYSDMQDAESSQRPRLEHPNSLHGPGNMQISGPASAVPLNSAYIGMDSRFSGALSRDPVLPSDVEVSSSLAGTGLLNGGIDGKFRGVLNHDHPAPPAGNSTSGYLGSGLPVGGGYVPPSVYGSEMYDGYRSSFVSSSVIPTASHALGFSQPSGGGTMEYPGVHPEVRSLAAGPHLTMHQVSPLPRETGSRARGSTNRYNFADMI